MLSKVRLTAVPVDVMGVTFMVARLPAWQVLGLLQLYPMVTDVGELMMAGVQIAGLVVEACRARKYRPPRATPDTWVGMV